MLCDSYMKLIFYYLNFIGTEAQLLMYTTAELGSGGGDCVASNL